MGAWRRSSGGPRWAPRPSCSGALPVPAAEHPDRVGDVTAAGERHPAEARKGGRAMEPRAAAADRSALARPATRRGVPSACGWCRHPHHPTHARTREHSTDAALSQRHRRGAAKRIGGELEKRKPTAPRGVTKLIGLVGPPQGPTDCPRFVPGLRQIWLRGRDLNPRPLGYEPNELPGCSTPRQGLSGGDLCAVQPRDRNTRVLGTQGFLSLFLRVLYSSVRASMGEIVAARCDGLRHAAIATIASTAAVAVSVAM